MLPSPYDVWAAREIVALIREAEVYKAELQSRFAVNRKIVGTAIGRDVVAALADYAPPMLTAHISQRVAFAESAASGRAVLENGGSKSPAAREIRALTDELLQLNGGSA